MSSTGFDTGLGLEDTHVLITGSAGAIGAVLVKAFLAAGAYVSAFDVVPSQPHPDHPRLQTQQVDVTNESRLEHALESAREKYGVMTTCILAAGVDLSYCQHASLIDMPLREWNRIMNVNVNGTFLTCRAWLRGMRNHATPESRNTSAIIVGSEAGIFGVADCAPYAVSKAGIQYGLVKSLARDSVDVHPRCRVNAVAPGPVATRQFAMECEADPGTQWRESQATVALRQAVPVEAVARACLFLASERFSGNITGQVLPVDSGKIGSLLWPDPRRLT